MKWTLFFFTLLLNLTCNGQTEYEIKLSNEVNEARMGVWINGNYKIYVDLNSVETYLRTTSQTSANAILYYNSKDSSVINYYNQTSQRYKEVAEQIEKARHGFDLTTLILYDGVEDKRKNVGKSRVVENFVKKLVENGTAIVLYKEKRIFKLKYQFKLKEEGHILNRGYEIRTYFDDLENCIFTEYRYMGW